MYNSYLSTVILLSTLSVPQAWIIDRNPPTGLTPPRPYSSNYFHIPDIEGEEKKPLTQYPKIQDHYNNGKYAFYHSPSEVVLHQGKDPHYKVYQDDSGQEPTFSHPNKINSISYLPYNHKVPDKNAKSKLKRYPKAPVTYLEPPKLSVECCDYYHKPKGKLSPAKKTPLRIIVQGQNYKEKGKLQPEANSLQSGKDKRQEDEEKSEEVYKPIRDHAPENYTNDEPAENETILKSRRHKDKQKVEGLSPDGDRVEFRIQGHAGPETYLFGYDTGDGRNRQYRVEERLKDGSVKGHYGYYDARGKLRVIKYNTGPSDGYVERHHETNLENESI